MTENELQLLELFTEQFKSKYKIGDRSPIGRGAYGFVLKGFDIHRSIPVAIKFYLNGVAPKGSERGWHLTSRVSHRQISSTHTIEEFSYDGKDCKAAISRLIPGKSLKSIFEAMADFNQEQVRTISDDLAKSFYPSLLEIISFCHRLDFGHGDLHAGNIMTFLSSEMTDSYQFEAVLIDFDNASFKEEISRLTEQEKIEMDFRMVAGYLKRQVLCDWKWTNEVDVIFSEYKSSLELKFAYDNIIKYISFIDNNIATSNNINTIFKNLLHAKMTGFKTAPVITSMRQIAATANFASDFETAYQKFISELKKTENWETDVVIIKDGHIKSNLYEKLFR